MKTQSYKPFNVPYNTNSYDKRPACLPQRFVSPYQICFNQDNKAKFKVNKAKNIAFGSDAPDPDGIKGWLHGLLSIFKGDSDSLNVDPSLADHTTAQDIFSQDRDVDTLSDESLDSIRKNMDWDDSFLSADEHAQIEGVSFQGSLSRADSEKVNAFRSWLGEQLGEDTANKLEHHAEISADIAIKKFAFLLTTEIASKLSKGEKVDPKSLGKLFLREARDCAIWTGGVTLVDIGIDKVGLGMSPENRTKLQEWTARKDGLKAANAHEGLINVSQEIIKSIESESVLSDGTKNKLLAGIETAVEILRAANHSKHQFTGKKHRHK